MNILIIGGNGGLGSAMVASCRQRWPSAILSATWHRSPPSSALSDIHWHQIDATSEDQISELSKQFDQLDLLINATGMLHTLQQGPEKSIKQFDPDFFINNLKINALPTLLLAKHFQKPLKASPNSHFVSFSARVGSIEDNQLGGWISYRSSKAALNMALKSISIEWQRTVPKCCLLAFHPGTVDTKLSEPFQKSVPDGKLFQVDFVANKLIELIETLTPKDSGQFWDYNKNRIPW